MMGLMTPEREERTMKKVLVVSDNTSGRWYDVEGDETPMEIADRLGRGDAGEMIKIWDDGNADRLYEDHRIAWDQWRHEYIACPVRY